MPQFPKPNFDNSERDEKILTCSKQDCENPSQQHVIIQGPVEYVGLEMATCIPHLAEMMLRFDIIDIHNFTEDCLHECSFNQDYLAPSEDDQPKIRQQMESAIKRLLN